MGFVTVNKTNVKAIIIMRSPAMGHVRIAAGPAILAQRNGPNSQPEPMIPATAEDNSVPVFMDWGKDMTILNLKGSTLALFEGFVRLASRFQEQALFQWMIQYDFFCV